MTQPTTVPWHRAAVGKFYALQSEASGVRAQMSAAHASLAALRLDRRRAEDYQAKLQETIAWHPVPHGRQADRDNTHRHLAEIEAEIERLDMLAEEAQTSRNQIAASLDRITPLLNAAITLMLKLKLITREGALFQ